LVCDSIHRLCVTGIRLGYRPGSLRRIFTGSYSLPPSLVAIWSFSDASDGVFHLLHLWVLPSSRRSSSWTISLLFSLACGWPLERMALCLANGGTSGNLGLKDLQVQEKEGRTDPWSGPGRPAWANRPRPISARFGHPFAPVGPHVFMHFAPSTCTILTMSSSRPRWRFSLHEVRSFTLQSSGMFLCNTSVLATFGSDFIKLLNTNKTPELLLWTCCDSVLDVHVFLHKHNTSKCTHKDELVIWLVCLVAG
jgi:hypothetical protein